jgi:hypothetical protein
LGYVSLSNKVLLSLNVLLLLIFSCVALSNKEGENWISLHSPKSADQFEMHLGVCKFVQQSFVVIKFFCYYFSCVALSNKEGEILISLHSPQSADQFEMHLGVCKFVQQSFADF